MKRLIVCISIVFCSGLCAWSQQDTGKIATLKGSVMDSTYQHSLIAATVALYKAQDTSLIAYTITDNSGHFQLASLPCNVPLQLMITYIGYKTIVRNCMIPNQQPVFDIGKLYAYRKGEKEGDELKEIVVKATPPMRMNGDTLEYYADAFKLDSSAVLEDLMRRLPGLTIWEDGVITVNGRKVQHLLVEGKPFFIDDSRFAMQNLPKNIVDKVQVYNTNAKKDSVMEVNVKLKKGKNRGIFGKISLGAGTSNRWEGDAMMSLFNEKTKFLLALATNNTHKEATSLIGRFLKGKNAEIKLSALDLLRQNKHIAVVHRDNLLSTTHTNTMGYYYMITLAYYPRKF